MSHKPYISEDSSLCWAYSSTTMLRRSLKDFFKKHKDDIDLKLTSAEQNEIQKWLDENEFHSILRQQIIMNPIPKRVQKENLNLLVLDMKLITLKNALKG